MVKYIVTHGIRIATEFQPETFGRLTTIGPRFIASNATGHKVTRQVCLCKCGNITVVRRGKLTGRHTQSCGCLVVDSGAANATHGHTRQGKKRPEYAVWHSMKARCTNPNCSDYSDYGGRGIKVCMNWSARNGYAAFISDMGLRPSVSHMLERKDNDKDYCPGNCRWATPQEQARNKRSTLIVTAFGQSKPLVTWAEERGMNYYTLWSRIVRNAWDAEKALSTPVRGRT